MCKYAIKFQIVRVFIILPDLFQTVPVSLQRHDEGNEWYQEEQKDADLIDGKTGIMNGVKGLNGEVEPAVMHAVHPVMGKDKGAKPDK